MIKKIILINLISFYYLLIAKTNTFAIEKGLLKGIDGDVEKLRRGDVDIDDISGALKGMIDIFLGLAGTIAIIFIIIGAYKLLFGSLKSDHTKGKDTIIMALIGFSISVLAWFIVKFIFDNFG